MLYRDALTRLDERVQAPLFVGPVWDEALDRRLRDTEPGELFGDAEIRDPKMAVCVLAGLHLANDQFDAAHGLCQGVATTTGSYWHGLCHRREGHRGEGLAANLNNARYWFRRVGSHEAFPEVWECALRVLDASGTGFRWATASADALRGVERWDPFMVIDWFAEIDAGVLSQQTAAIVEEIQWRELRLLTDWCARRALGE
jgi:hypothetical protein